MYRKIQERRILKRMAKSGIRYMGLSYQKKKIARLDTF